MNRAPSDRILIPTKKPNGWAFLSNFWPFVSDEARSAITALEPAACYSGSFTIDGVEYPSVEHYFQSEKYKHIPEIWEEITLQPTALDCKKCADKHAKTNPIDVAKWSAMSEEVMRQAVMAKFMQNPALLKALKSTGSATLAEEAGKFPSQWTQQPDGTPGKLGLILMHVRDKFPDGQVM